MKLSRVTTLPARAISAWRDVAGPRDFVSVLLLKIGVNLRQPFFQKRFVRHELRVKAVNAPRATVMRLGSTDIHVFSEIFRRGEYDAVRQHLKDARLVVDLGANIGVTCQYWKSLFPAAEIVAVEPGDSNFATLQKNLEGLPRPAVRCIKACVGGSRRTETLTDLEGDWALSIAPDSQKRGRKVAEVPVITMEDVLADLPPDLPIDLLKCDIEGAEVELLATCKTWIHRVRHLVIEVHGSYTHDSVVEDLRRNGVAAETAFTRTQEVRQVAFFKCTPLLAAAQSA